MYFILLLKLDWMLSGCHRKIYMTKAQLSVANTGQAFSSILIFSFGSNLCVHSVGVGVRAVIAGGSILNRANASITLANTYITICCLTGVALRPKT